MGRIGVGIDCGSAVCKGIFLKDGSVAAAFAAPVSWSPGETARAVLDELLRQGQATRAEAYVVATGYGRVAIDFADKKLTEITCHALGAEHLLPGARTVIDIGGQDSKVISVDRGRVLAFQMNDKCAAGTGRFVEMSA
ncbi:(R)-2-hydroxyglutaryl-CoA dehydratase activating ATPase [bioreactor metagenome]|uniref:(R)-2-hydroxyglutaryl-CoA dehydratase activating ATPase n=1 Tax=bioreactor metagenome TaxID=1076179 RepID=A0A644Y644_9ZZZZ